MRDTVRPMRLSLATLSALLFLPALALGLACDGVGGDGLTDEQAICMSFYDCFVECGPKYPEDVEIPGADDDAIKPYTDCTEQCYDDVGAAQGMISEQEFWLSQYASECAIERTWQGEPVPPCDDEKARTICTEPCSSPDAEPECLLNDVS